MTTSDVIARGYIEAVGRHDLDTVNELLAADLVAEFAGASLDKAGWIAALRRLLPAVVRNDIRQVFTDDQDGTCIVYDFVTDTAAGAVRCVEVVEVRDERIRRVELILDRVAFAPVNESLRERAAAPSR